MIRGIVIALAVLAPFLFPWPLAVLLAIPVALLLPFASIVIGILFEVLYYLPGAAHVPYAALTGLLGFAVALLVQHFIKVRSMGI